MPEYVTHSFLLHTKHPVSIQLCEKLRAVRSLLGSHLTQKTGIRQTFFQQQTIPNTLPFQITLDVDIFNRDLLRGLRTHVGDGDSVTDILIFGMSKAFCPLPFGIEKRTCQRAVYTKMVVILFFIFFYTTRL